MHLVDKVFPKIEATAVSKQYGRFIISPLESGYGLTLGNALRRVLLTSLPGAAATSMRVMGVQHEFAPVPSVREDMTSLMLNLKQVRFRVEGTDMGRARMRVRGPAEVTAGDLETPAGIEILNPELHLATVDSGDDEFELEVSVATGRGYSPSEERGSLPIGEIPLDAIFSPVRRATFTVEHERVGPTTDFDRLVIEVWTDGTLAPETAVSQAARLLVEHFQLVSLAETVEVQPEEPEAEQIEAPKAGAELELPIESLELNQRAFNCLKRAGIATVGQVLDKLVNNPKELTDIRNFGAKSLEDLKSKLIERGLYGEPGSADEAGAAAGEGDDETPSDEGTTEIGVGTDEA